MHPVLDIIARGYDRGRLTPAHQSMETIGSISIGHFDLKCRHLTVTCTVRHARIWSKQLLCHKTDSFKIADKTVDLHMSDKPYLSLLSTGWSVEEVNRQFLERAGLGYMAEQFYANKINGKCLMLLNEVS